MRVQAGRAQHVATSGKGKIGRREERASRRKGRPVLEAVTSLYDVAIQYVPSPILVVEHPVKGWLNNANARRTCRKG